MSGTSITFQNIAASFLDGSNKPITTLDSVTALNNPAGPGGTVIYGDTAGPTWVCDCTAGSGYIGCDAGCTTQPSALDNAQSIAIDGSSHTVVFSTLASGSYSVGACTVADINQANPGIACGSPATYTYASPAQFQLVA